MPTVYLGADHGGFELKNRVAEWLKTQGYQVVDCGNTELNPGDDYPEFAFAVGEQVASHPDSKGIVFCRSSIGVVIAANKVPGILAGSVMSPEMTAKARQHDNINVLGIAADWLSEEQVKSIITAFLTTPFESLERRTRRLNQILAKEQEYHAH